MNNSFYIKLAVNNLKRNKNVYLPFLVACIGTIFTCFVFLRISTNTGMVSLPHGSKFLQGFFSSGKVFGGFFAIVFILYANSFLMKRRMKEVGLYGVLGLEKRHIMFVMLIEMLILYVISIVVAIVFGMVLGNLFFLIFLRILHIAGTNTFTISPQAFYQTIFFFFGVFSLAFLLTIIKIKNANIITLLKVEEQGEKEPKTPIFMSIIGIVTLILGYGIALYQNSQDSQQNIIGYFIISVILILIGTYTLFSAGSIALLKGMKKNKALFYKPNNFISVSNMIYRMKKNGVGLANICILSTVVILVLSTTLALYTGRENILKNKNQFDLKISLSKNDKTLMEKIQETAVLNNVSLKDVYQYKIAHFTGYLEKNMLSIATTVPKETDKQKKINYEVNVLTLEDYNKITNGKQSLNKNEILIYTLYENYGLKNLTMGDDKSNVRYSIKKELNSFVLQEKNKKIKVGEIFIVVSDLKQVQKLQSIMNVDELQSFTNLNLEGTELDCLAFASKLKDIVNQKYSTANFYSIDIDRADWYGIFGGALFLGIFLGFLFMIALVLIIYFKQISEGYEDHNRFTILQKVGMDKSEVKKTITKQIRLMFFLPIVGAVIHMLVFSNIICRVLAAFYLTDTNLIFRCILCLSALFTIWYSVVYFMTVKVYYKMVQ